MQTVKTSLHEAKKSRIFLLPQHELSRMMLSEIFRGINFRVRTTKKNFHRDFVSIIFLRIFYLESNETSDIKCRSKNILKKLFLCARHGSNIFSRRLSRGKDKKAEKRRNYAKSLFEIPFNIGSIISRSYRHHLCSIADIPQIRGTLQNPPGYTQNQPWQ